MDYIRAPFNYPGGKHALLDRLLPLFPEGIGTFVDLFGGSFSVGMNAKSEHKVYNDANHELSGLQKAFRDMRYGSITGYVERKVDEWGLSAFDPAGFHGFRRMYNNSHKHPLDLYVLMCFSHNYQPRWDTEHHYNAPHGLYRARWNNNLRKRLHTYTHFLEYYSIEFSNVDFREYDTKNLTEDDFIYLDPPYHLTDYPYGNGWTSDDEKDLLTFLDGLTGKGLRWGLTRTLSYGPYRNDEMMEFISRNDELKVHELPDLTGKGIKEAYITIK